LIDDAAFCGDGDDLNDGVYGDYYYSGDGFYVSHARLLEWLLKETKY
jgi:hypothetical protein